MKRPPLSFANLSEAKSRSSVERNFALATPFGNQIKATTPEATVYFCLQVSSPTHNSSGCTPLINERNKTHQQALDDKNPSPALQPAPRPNRRQPPCQKPSKGARQRRRRVEDADAESQLAARVHAGQVQHDAGKEAALGDAQQGAHGGEAAKGADEAETHGDDAPGDGQRGEPDARGEFLEDEVAGEFAGREGIMLVIAVLL